MKAAPFDYVRAESLEQALECLSQHGMDAKAIAGGQSLVPMMAMRLARPTVLLDIYRLHELQKVNIKADRVLMGATTRQRTVEHGADLHAALPLVRDALQWVGHIQTRNRGTVGGSLVHADPSAELPLAAMVLNATLHLQSQADGKRQISAQEFFLGPMFTATGETECLVEIEWPVWQGTVTTAFEETAMRHGDYAMASAGCQLQLDAGGICRRAAFGVGGVDGTPRAFPDLALELVGHRVDADLATEVAHAALQQTEPGSDLYANADYRRHLGVWAPEVCRQGRL
jgi:carbon-monoxide dehydrogenase medium subunit/2-furoyl-CoA dehydrogenase FAD binding subunit